MTISFNELGSIESFYGSFEEPSGVFAEVEPESSWCCLCGEGEDHHNIKICRECFEYLMNEIN